MDGAWLREIPIFGLNMVSIRTVVPVIISAQIAVAVGLTGLISYVNGQKAVNDVAAQVREQLASRIDSHVSEYLATPQVVLGSMAGQFKLGLLSPQNVREGQNLSLMERYLGQQSYLFDSVGYLLVANEAGDYVGVEKSDRGIRTIDLANSGGAFRKYGMGKDGNRGQLIRESGAYDPRDRPYYKAAVRTGKQSWTEVYNAFGYENRPTITASQPIYRELGDGKRGDLLGVVGVDLILSQISQFLGELEISKSGMAFIVEPSGQLIATSTGEAVIGREGEQKNQRLMATGSGTALIRSTAEYLQGRYGGFKIAEGAQLGFEAGGKRNFVEVRSLKQFDWLVVVVIPEADFMAQIQENSRTTALLCLASLGVASGVGLWTARRLTRPIGTLSAAATAIEAETYTPELLETEIRRKDEFGQLARIFYAMAEQVRTRSGDLRDKIRQLEADQTNRGTGVSESEDGAMIRELLERARAIRRG
jgi:HAMP domain-containing protein